MAKVLRITDIDQSTGVTVNLISGTLKLQDGTWQTRKAGERTIETMKLVAFQASDTTIIAGEAAINNALYLANRWHSDPSRGASYWLETNATSESARRSLIYDGVLETETVSLNNPLLGAQGGEAFFKLALTRHPLWENVAGSTGASTGLSTLGGKATLSDPGGTADGRLAKLRLSGVSGSALTRFWVGIRPTYYGTGGYKVKWECESGTLGTDTSTSASTTHSNNGKALISFATVATMTNRVTLVVGNSTAPEHMVGRYLVLARAYVSAGTIGLKMKTGFTSTTNAEHRTVYISNTAPKLIELGEIQIPGNGYRDQMQGSNNVKNFTLVIAAERVSGAGTCSLDCILLVPTEHFLYLDGVSVSKPGADWPTDAYTLEDDSITTLSYTVAAPSTSVLPTHSGTVNAHNWGVPKDGGVLVMAAECSTAQVAAQTDSISYTIHPRWRQWRG